MRIPTWTHLEGAETVINDSTWQIPASGVKHKHNALLFFFFKNEKQRENNSVESQLPHSFHLLHSKKFLIDH
jgi:hypothetical protein